MASTIQIKRGTGSAVPSGLADGELAINLDNGRLYFGSGSTSVNDFSFGEITAEKYIVSSSVLYVTTSFSSGSTEFGDTVDDTHTFTGNITASGDISASGVLYADKWGSEYVGNNISMVTDNRIDFNPSNTTAVRLSDSLVTLNKDTKILGNVTASGNISASGTIVGFNLSGINTGDQNISNLAITGSDVIFANITASGNISSSGQVTANNLYINDYGVANSTGTSLRLGYDNSLTTLTYGLNSNTSHFFYGAAITASIISASGEIKAKMLDIVSTSNFADDITIGDTKKIIGARLIISASNSTNFYGTTTFNDTISDVTSTGTVTAADVFINGDLNSGTPILSFSSSQTPQGGIAYYDSGDIARYAFFFPSPDVVSIANRASNGTVQIRANNSTAGGGGEVTSSIFTSFSNEFLLPVTSSGNISASGDIYATNLELDDATESTINMYQAGTQRIKISGRSGQDTYFNAGDVAIGTDTPAEKLTVEGNISASGTITADRFLGSQLTMVPFNYYVSANHSTELYVPQGGSQVESNYDNPYHLMLAPYDGKVRRVSVYYQTGDPGDLTARVRKAAAPFDIDDADDIVQEETISSAVDDTAYFFDFSASFSKGDAVALTLEAASHASNCYVVGTIAVEYDTTT